MSCTQYKTTCVHVHCYHCIFSMGIFYLVPLLLHVTTFCLSASLCIIIKPSSRHLLTMKLTKKKKEIVNTLTT